MGLIEAVVVARRMAGTEQGAGLEVALLDFDIRRQVVAAHRQCVVQRREIGTEMACQKRPEKTFLDVAARRRRGQRQRGVELQAHIRLCRYTARDRIEQPMLDRKSTRLNSSP